MTLTTFITHNEMTGQLVHIPSVTESQMREVDRIAVEDFGLGILQMMENAGRNLASLALRIAKGNQAAHRDLKFVIAAGTGGNGGGGLCAARHLHNRGFSVALLLTKPVESYSGPAGVQLNILRNAGLVPSPPEQINEELSSANIILDALIGYSLIGAPGGRTKKLIEAINASGKPVLSLDLPSGLDATTGKTPGAVVSASATLTLALPKPGLVDLIAGELYLADIGIPPEVYAPLGIYLTPFFGPKYIVQLERPA
jgi:NAD(P)H-hydrate epimerase